MNLTLYHYWRSSASWRVRWVLEVKNLKPKYVHVGLLDGESERESHLSRNPFGYVPVLEVDGHNLIESVAIIEFLEEKVPGPSLFPGDAFQRAHIRALVEVINADTHPIQNLSVTERLPENQQKEWKVHFITRGLSVYETLAKPLVGKFSVGDQITAADIVLIPQCYNALRNEIDLNRFPLIAKIYHAALQTKECQSSHPDQFKP